MDISASEKRVRLAAIQWAINATQGCKGNDWVKLADIRDEMRAELAQYESGSPLYALQSSRKDVCIARGAINDAERRLTEAIKAITG